MARPKRLLRAIRSQNEKETFNLIRQGGEVVFNHEDEDGYTALFEACRRENVDIIKLLLDVGAHVHH